MFNPTQHALGQLAGHGTKPAAALIEDGTAIGLTSWVNRARQLMEALNDLYHPFKSDRAFRRMLRSCCRRSSRSGSIYRRTRYHSKLVQEHESSRRWL